MCIRDSAAFAVDVMKADSAVSPEFKQAGSRVYVVPAEKDEQDLPCLLYTSRCV